MTKTVQYSVFRGSPSGDVISEEIRKTIGPNEVFLEISHAGLCGTDRFFKDRKIVLGHEGAGKVRDVGSMVTYFKPGDRVGFGWVQKVCGTCDWCITDKDQYCEQRQQYGTKDYEVGSFATHAVFDQSMLIKIPDGLESEYAAPLMCGGATVWGALTSYNLQPGDRVAIAGIGGLGHLAIQFASALGCDVVVLSSNPQKKDEAMGLGAKEYHVFRDTAPDIAPVKHLFWTGNSTPDFSKLVDKHPILYQVCQKGTMSLHFLGHRILPLISNDGGIYLLTISDATLNIPALPLVINGIKVQGSAVAPRLAIRKMLGFVVLHGIRPIIMTWPMTIDGIQAAFKTMEEGRMRYRGVLVSQSYLMGNSAVEVNNRT